jgi:hypothetical protein
MVSWDCHHFLQKRLMMDGGFYISWGRGGVPFKKINLSLCQRGASNPDRGSQKIAEFLDLM